MFKIPERIRLPQSFGGLAAAFSLPVILMIVIFSVKGIFPFGEESFLSIDLYFQYAPFFSEFQHKLLNEGSLLYSWNLGMGVNFTALYAYYLASPLNWLLIFCPKAYLIEFMTYAIVLKMGLAGLSFAYYLGKHNHRSDFGVGLFGAFYAMSGYMAAYSWNIMWLDCILLFPLIMLGLEKLVKEKKGLLYCITLGLSILSNYYISIMICIFLVIYFLCLQILEGKRSKKDTFIGIVQFSGYSLLAGGLAGVILLPEMFALQSTISGDISFPKTLEQYFTIFDMLARHISNVPVDMGLVLERSLESEVVEVVRRGLGPNIFCGVAVFLFFPLYLFNRWIPVREKVVYCGLLLLFLASFSVNVLDFIWHGFHYPNALPSRQSFIYIFLMLALCYRAYMYLKDTPKKHIAAALWGFVCYILLAQKLVTEEVYHFSIFYIAILFLTLYVGLIAWYKNPQKDKVIVAILTVTVVVLEAGMNMVVTGVPISSRTDYLADNENVAALTGDLTSDHGFYRIEKENRKTQNDGAWMNVPSASLFSSLAHGEMTSFFKKMGCGGTTNAYSMIGSTPFVDSLFSVKFSIWGEAQDDPGMILKKKVGDTYLYENPYTLPLGFMMPDAMETDWQLDLQNPMEVHNHLADTLMTPALFTEIDVDGSGTAFGFTPERDGEYYVCIGNETVESVTVTMGGESETIHQIDTWRHLVEVGFCRAGERISVKNEEGSEALNASVWIFEEEGMKAVYQRLNSSPFLLNTWNDDALEGTIEAADSGTVFFSIPYDKGWTVLVDGQKVRPRKLLGAFMGVDLPAGAHKITMNYMPEGLKMGAAISGICMMILVLPIFSKRRYRRKKAQREKGRREKGRREPILCSKPGEELTEDKEKI